MVKRFRQDKAVWLNYGTFLLQQGQSDAASALLQRALKSLPSKESKLACPDTEDVMSQDSVMHINMSELVDIAPPALSGSEGRSGVRPVYSLFLCLLLPQVWM